MDLPYEFIGFADPFFFHRDEEFEFPYEITRFLENLITTSMLCFFNKIFLSEFHEGVVFIMKTIMKKNGPEFHEVGRNSAKVFRETITCVGTQYSQLRKLLHGLTCQTP